MRGPSSSASTLRQVQIVMRHGDRAPVFNAHEGARTADEWMSSWVSRHGKAPSAHATRFPIQNWNAATMDAKARPWGVLTQRGIRQATERGKRLGARYADLLRRDFERNVNGGGVGEEKEKASSTAGSGEAKKSNNASAPASGQRPLVAASASNFTRTQITTQCALAGMLAGSGLEGDGGSTTTTTTTSSSSASSASSSPVGHIPIPVVVGPANVCHIAAFDNGNGVMGVARKIFSSPLYLEREASLRAESALLTSTLPFFKFPPTASSAPTAFTSGDEGTLGSRFMWIRAYDYFACSAAHGLPIFPEIAHLHSTTQSQLLWRFRTLFGFGKVGKNAVGRHVLALASRNMLLSLLSTAEEAAGKRTRGGGEVLEGAVTGGDAEAAIAPMPSVHLVGGHDVTLLPLLLIFVESKQAGGEGIKCLYSSGKEEVLPAGSEEVVAAVPWPGYASSISLELHEVGEEGSGVEGKEGGKGGATGTAAGDRAATGDGRWRLRWRYDDEPLTGEREAHQPPPPEHLVGMSGEVTLEELRRVAAELEKTLPPAL